MRRLQQKPPLNSVKVVVKVAITLVARAAVAAPRTAKLNLQACDSGDLCSARRCRNATEKKKDYVKMRFAKTPL